VAGLAQVGGLLKRPQRVQAGAANLVDSSSGWRRELAAGSHDSTSAERLRSWLDREMMIRLPKAARPSGLQTAAKAAMTTKSREVIWGRQIMGAEMRAQSAREAAQKAAREADRAEAQRVVAADGRLWRARATVPNAANAINMEKCLSLKFRTCLPV
jgi:hypothetical protein